MLIVLISAVLTGFWGTLSILEHQPFGIHLPGTLLNDATKPAVRGVREGPFQMKPPSQGLEGAVLEVSGTPLYSSRELGGGQILTEQTVLYDGESVSTDDSSTATIAFGETTIALAGSSMVSFVNTIPFTLFVEQNQGSVQYSTTSQLTSRIRSALFFMNRAEARLSFDEESFTTTISVQSGTVVISFLDDQYETVRYEVNAGEEGILDYNTLLYEVQ